MAQLTLLNGLVGGLIATLVMTAFQMVLGGGQPPTAQFWSQYVGDGPADAYLPQGLALHFVYGIGMGAVFVLLLPLVGIDAVSATTGVLYGLGWGVVLFVGAAVFWMNVVLDMDAEPGQVGLFLFFHLIYGGLLGAVVGYGVV